MSEPIEPVPTKSKPRTPISPSDVIKVILMLGLGVIGLFIEFYGWQLGYLVYLAIVIALLVMATGLSAFTNSYNYLFEASDTDVQTVRNRLRLSAEKAAAMGVASLTVSVALGLYSLDATNSEANSAKLRSIQYQMMPKAKKLGCQLVDTDPDDCKRWHKSLNILWDAVLKSDVSGMVSGVDGIRVQWMVLGARWPYQDLQEFYSAIDAIDSLKYTLDRNKQAIALLIAGFLLPFSVGSTSRKLGVAVFEADTVKVPMTWRLASKRALLGCLRVFL